MRFASDFDIERTIDWVKVTNKDGTDLWLSNSNSNWETRHQRFESNANSVEVHFHTDVSYTQEGWRLEWGEYEQKS